MTPRRGAASREPSPMSSSCSSSLEDTMGRIAPIRPTCCSATTTCCSPNPLASASTCSRWRGGTSGTSPLDTVGQKSSRPTWRMRREPSACSTWLTAISSAAKPPLAKVQTRASDARTYTWHACSNPSLASLAAPKPKQACATPTGPNPSARCATIPGARAIRRPEARARSRFPRPCSKWPRRRNHARSMTPRTRACAPP